MKSNKLIKFALIGGGGAVVLIVIGVILFVANLDRIVKVAVEKTLSYVLEVDVTLEGVEIAATSGEVVLKGLVIPNPEGFNTASAIEFDEIFQTHAIPQGIPIN